MSTLKLGLAQMSTPEKVQFARRLAGAMDEYYYYFPDMPVQFDTVMDFAYATEAAFNQTATARDAARTAATQLENTEEVLDGLLTTVARYVQSSTNGDARLIQLMGFDLGKPPAPVGPLPSPENLNATEGIGPGEIALSWRPVRGVVSYEAQQREVGASGEWVSAGFSTRAKLTVPGLRSGTQYEFRVVALGAAGPSPWSAPVTKFAP